MMRIGSYYSIKSKKLNKEGDVKIIYLTQEVMSRSSTRSSPVRRELNHNIKSLIISSKRTWLKRMKDERNWMLITTSRNYSALTEKLSKATSRLSLEQSKS